MTAHALASSGLGSGSTMVMARYGWIRVGGRWRARLTPTDNLANRRKREQLGEAIAKELTTAVVGMTTEINYES